MSGILGTVWISCAGGEKMKVALVPWLRYGLPVTFSGGAGYKLGAWYGRWSHCSGCIIDGNGTKDKGGAWTILPSGQTDRQSQVTGKRSGVRRRRRIWQRQQDDRPAVRWKTAPGVAVIKGLPNLSRRTVGYSLFFGFSFKVPSKYT